MVVSHKHKLIYTLTIINSTPSLFWRDDTAAIDTPADFPLKLQPQSTTSVTLEGNPHLPQDITIDYNIKKTIFAATAIYTNYSQSLRFQTVFSYCYRKRLNHRAPKVEFFWDHSATSIGQVPVLSLSFLQDNSSTYPYPYSSIAVIAASPES